MSVSDSPKDIKSFLNDAARFCSAARASRLPPDSLADVEKTAFPALLVGPNATQMQRLYLTVRNRILHTWLKNPKNFLSKTTALSLIPTSLAEIAKNVYQFLDLHRYINFGVLNFPRAPPPAPKLGDVKVTRVVVVGAGMAGIATARELQNIYRGRNIQIEVVLLEARDRLGGRMHTVYLQTRPESSSRPCGVDVAAQIVTGFEGGNPMDVLINHQLTIPVHTLRNAENCQIHDIETGSVVDADLDSHADSIFNEALDKACRSVAISSSPVELEILPYEVKRERAKISRCAKGGPDGETEMNVPSLGEALDYHLRRDPSFASLNEKAFQLVHWHMSNLEFANGSNVNDLSLYHWDQDDAWEFTGPHCMVKGGYGQVAHLIAKGRPSQKPLNIEFNAEAREVHTSDGGVRVVCADGRVFEGDHIVITLPLGVLKRNSVTFSPPLPLSKTSAIDRLGFGFFNKVILVFPEVFWPIDDDSFGTLAHFPAKRRSPNSSPSKSTDATPACTYTPQAYELGRGRYFLFWNLYPVTKMPILVAFVSGAAAQDVEDESDTIVVRKAMAVLARVFPEQNPLPRPVESIVTRWARDPFARGTYSYIRNGSSGADYDRLAEPVGKNMYFAGEATCRQYPATVHGAMLSGMRVASEIAENLLKIKPE